MRRLWTVPLAALPLALLPLAQPAFAGEPGKNAPAASASASGVTATVATSPIPAAPTTAKTDSSAIAEELFHQGIALMEAGKYAEACPKFEGSNKAAWAPGTTINLADCYEKTGKPASAWAKFMECEPHFRSRVPPDNRADIAKQRADALYPRLSRLTIAVPPGSRIAGLVIKRDGEVVDETQWGTGLPLDPGEHVIEASAPGKEPWTSTRRVEAEASTVVLEIPSLKDAAPGSTPGVTDPAMPVQKKLAIGVSSLGNAGLILGAVFGGLTLAKVSEADKSCSKTPDGSFACDAAGVKARDDAKGMATISTIGFIAGGVLAAGGIVLWLTAPSTSAVEPVKDTNPAVKSARRPAIAPARFWLAPVLGQTNGVAAGATF